MSLKHYFARNECVIMHRTTDAKILLVRSFMFYICWNVKWYFIDMQNKHFEILIKLLFWMWLKYILYITYNALSKNRSEQPREWHWNWAVRKFKCSVFCWSRRHENEFATVIIIFTIFGQYVRGCTTQIVQYYSCDKLV